MWPLHRSKLPAAQQRLNEFDRLLVKRLVEFSKSGCRSLKHHQWSHYSHHRLQTGCTAMEKGFEHSYAVGHKKQVQFTNKAMASAEQTANKHFFRNGIRRLASSVGLPLRHGINSHLDESSELQGPFTQLENHEWESPRAAHYLRLKGAAMRPRLVRCSKSMTIRVQNRLERPTSVDYHHTIHLRATHGFKNPVVDIVRTRQRGRGNEPVVAFGRCLGFFADAEGGLFVAVQWYKICGRSPVDRNGRMTKVQLQDAYDYVPVQRVLNGALLMPVSSDAAVVGQPKQFWVIQSHREKMALIATNTTDDGGDLVGKSFVDDGLVGLVTRCGKYRGARVLYYRMEGKEECSTVREVRKWVANGTAVQ